MVIQCNTYSQYDIEYPKTTQTSVPSRGFHREVFSASNHPLGGQDHDFRRRGHVCTHTHQMLYIDNVDQYCAYTVYIIMYNIYIYYFIYGHPPMIYLEAFYMEIIMFLAYKA